ncbi:MAG TPA: site-specific integrase [Kineosporiaceae bacterium]
MHSVCNPSGVRFVGPVAPFASGLVQELASLGYTTNSATMQMQLAAALSRWLAAGGVGLDGLTPAVMDQFLLERRRRRVRHYSPRALIPIVGYLRRLGVMPSAPVGPVGPVGAVEVLLERFAGYLAGQRALTPAVVAAYVHWVRPFVEEVACSGGVDRVGELSAGVVAGFVTTRLPVMSSVKKAQITACALRSFLRFLHAEGMTAMLLVDAVPSVASWRLSGLPQPLSSAQVEALLDACDGSSPVGRRDLAVITMMRRMGLRCAEVAALRLEDLDWLAGTVTVHGKSARIDRMPLPVDVGAALVDYLRVGRPATAARTVFVRAKAPFTPLHSSSVSCIVARAADRAGLGTVHGHRLRHTAATETLNAGASLEEVAQLLRHSGVATTVVYAKTDQSRLAQLARPWPVGTAGTR